MYLTGVVTTKKTYSLTVIILVVCDTRGIYPTICHLLLKI